MVEFGFGAVVHPGKARPGRPIRLKMGRHYLKRAFDESHQPVVERIPENPCWQYFWGFANFRHRFTLHPAFLVKWRKRVGPKGL